MSQILQASTKIQKHSVLSRLVLRQFVEQHSNVEHVRVLVDERPLCSLHSESQQVQE
jgi:hypothetical protein